MEHRVRQLAHADDGSRDRDNRGLCEQPRDALGDAFGIIASPFEFAGYGRGCKQCTEVAGNWLLCCDELKHMLVDDLVGTIDFAVGRYDLTGKIGVGIGKSLQCIRQT